MLFYNVHIHIIRLMRKIKLFNLKSCVFVANYLNKAPGSLVKLAGCAGQPEVALRSRRETLLRSETCRDGRFLNFC